MTLVSHDGKPVDIEGVTVGDILVHPKYTVDSLNGCVGYITNDWTVTHIPTGCSLEGSKPAKHFTEAKLTAWAKRAQAINEPAWLFIACLPFGTVGLRAAEPDITAALFEACAKAAL